MKYITIRHAGGVGDGLMFSSIIKEKYATLYDEVYIDVPRLNWLFKDLYSDSPNVKFGNRGQVVLLNFKDVVEHPSWRRLTWNRNELIENKIYSEIVNKFGTEYILIHERVSDNMGRTMLPIDRSVFLNKNLPVINLDSNWLSQNGLSVENILHYGKLLNNASEIHVYEGSFMNLSDSIVEGVPLFGHMYCKPHLFNENLVHNQIIKYIKLNKWHKRNWNYIWES